MRRPLILEMLENNTPKNMARFHMPGHKGAEEFAKLFPVATADITELSFSGCLSSHEGVIYQAEQNIKEIFNSKRSFITTDGSSSAILAMCYVLSKRGKKVIIPRNSHKSVYNGLKIFNLSPIFSECFLSSGIIMQGEISEELISQSDVAGVLITSPDYYGNVYDLEKLKKLTQRYGKILAVDGAHGSHLRFLEPSIYAGAFADIWVDGVHKTLPCLTQSAILHVGDEFLISDAEEGLNLFRTTSPSYPIMASLEYGVYFAESEGKTACEKIISMAKSASKRLDGKGYKFVFSRDGFKILLDMKESNVNAKLLEKHLEDCGVYFEFSDGRYMVFMISFLTKKSQLDALFNALDSFERSEKTAYNAQNRQNLPKLPKVATPFGEVFYKEGELVPYSQALGRVSAENVGFFPPCYPVFCAGEILEDELLVEKLAKSDNVFGLTDGLFKVIK